LPHSPTRTDALIRQLFQYLSSFVGEGRDTSARGGRPALEALEERAVPSIVSNFNGYDPPRKRLQGL
jgi:hypothetical protein